MKRVFEITVGRDELGQSEECTWDLIPVVSSELTSHLDADGLPKEGTVLHPGMILVGKIGKSKAYATERKPTELEIQALDFEELKEQFGHLWIDGSFYVPEGMHGVVTSCDRRLNADGTGTISIELDTATIAAG
jgi:DNA-directed RNA polymerase beta subunit